MLSNPCIKRLAFENRPYPISSINKNINILVSLNTILHDVWQLVYWLDLEQVCDSSIDLETVVEPFFKDSWSWNLKT